MQDQDGQNNNIFSDINTNDGAVGHNLHWKLTHSDIHLDKYSIEHPRQGHHDYIIHLSLSDLPFSAHEK